jgi:hypothetical protein
VFVYLFFVGDFSFYCLILIDIIETCLLGIETSFLFVSIVLLLVHCPCNLSWLWGMFQFAQARGRVVIEAPLLWLICYINWSLDEVCCLFRLISSPRAWIHVQVVNLVFGFVLLTPKPNVAAYLRSMAGNARSGLITKQVDFVVARIVIVQCADAVDGALARATREEFQMRTSTVPPPGCVV